MLEIAIAKLASGLRVANEKIRVVQTLNDLRRTLATCGQARLALERAIQDAPTQHPGLEVLSKTTKPLKFRSLSRPGYERMCRDYFLRNERRLVSLIPGASKLGPKANSA